MNYAYNENADEGESEEKPQNPSGNFGRFLYLIEDKDESLFQDQYSKGPAERSQGVGNKKAKISGSGWEFTGPLAVASRITSLKLRASLGDIFFCGNRKPICIIWPTETEGGAPDCGSLTGIVS